MGGKDLGKLRSVQHPLNGILRQPTLVGQGYKVRWIQRPFNILRVELRGMVRWVHHHLMSSFIFLLINYSYLVGDFAIIFLLATLALSFEMVIFLLLSNW